MNTQFLKSQYAGFRLNDTLASRINFSGIIRCRDIRGRTIHNFDEDIPYWIVIGDMGERMSTFDKRLADSVVPGETYKVKGEVKISKGATFLNLKEATPFNGREFSDSMP
jgi:hypothetical protein